MDHVGTIAVECPQRALIELRYDAPLPTLPVYLVSHKELRHVPRVRLVVTALTDAMRKARV